MFFFFFFFFSWTRRIQLFGHRITCNRFVQRKWSAITNRIFTSRRSFFITKIRQVFLHFFQDDTSIISYCPIDENGCRYLLTDYRGKLYLLVLERDKRNGSSSSTITDMKVMKIDRKRSKRKSFHFDFSVGSSRRNIDLRIHHVFGQWRDVYWLEIRR